MRTMLQRLGGGLLIGIFTLGLALSGAQAQDADSDSSSDAKRLAGEVEDKVKALCRAEPASCEGVDLDSGRDVAQLTCRLLLFHDLEVPAELDCVTLLNENCPCFSAADVAAGGATGCSEVTLTCGGFRVTGISSEPITQTSPVCTGGLGRFVVEDYACSVDGAVTVVDERERLGCIAALEAAVGSCQ